MSGVLRIDGSYGEGGGQVSRYAMALAAITGRPIRLVDIRARRPKPGLMAQHLTALRAVAAISGGTLDGAELGARELRFDPGRIAGGEFRFDVGTAGSVILVLQALLPVALRAEAPCRFHITGGTDVRAAPPLDYLRLVFLPWLARMGAQVGIESVRHGYYPRGGGAIVVTVAPCRRLLPLVAERPGRLRAIRGVAHVARLPLQIAERMASAAGAALAGLGPTGIVTRALGEDESSGTGGALVLAAETESGVLGAAAVAERGIPAERIGDDVGKALRAEIESGAAVDVHAADQLLPYLALAAGGSRFTTRTVSLHASTVMWLVEQFLPVRFEVTPWHDVHRVAVTAAGHRPGDVAPD